MEGLDVYGVTRTSAAKYNKHDLLKPQTTKNWVNIF